MVSNDGTIGRRREQYGLRHRRRHRNAEHEGAALRRARPHRCAMVGELSARHAGADVGRAVAAGLARRDARVYCRLRPRGSGGGSSLRSGECPCDLHQQPVRRLGDCGRRGHEPASSGADLARPPRERRGGLGARSCRRRAVRGGDRQRHRQLLRLHEDAVAEEPSSRRVGEDALARAAERVRRLAPDRTACRRSLCGRRYRRRLRLAQRDVVRRDARCARHPAGDDAGAARRLGRDCRSAELAKRARGSGCRPASPFSAAASTRRWRRSRPASRARASTSR